MEVFLTMGHVGLNDYLLIFNMNDSNLCQQCNAPETIDHFLLYCEKYNLERANLIQQLRKNNVLGLNVKTLLCGSAQHYNKRRSIYASVSTFLLAAGRLNELWYNLISNVHVKLKITETISPNCMIQEKLPNIVLFNNTPQEPKEEEPISPNTPAPQYQPREWKKR